MIYLQANTTPVNISDSIKVATENIIHNIKEDPDTFFHELGQDAIQFGIKIIAALVIFLVGIWLIRLITKWMRRSFDRRKVEKTVSSFVCSFSSIALYVLLVVITISTLGVNTTSIAAILAAAGVAIGVSLSGTLQNFAGGLIILIFKQFKAGDFIDAQGCSGTVIDVTMAYTRIRTVDNRVIIIPNGALINGTIDNYSVNPIRRVEWTVNVEYDSDIDVCMKTLYDIIGTDKRILDSSTAGAADPTVVLSSLNHDDISFVMRVWARSEDFWELFYDINKAIYIKLPQAGISFASKRMDVTVSQKQA